MVESEILVSMLRFNEKAHFVFNFPECSSECVRHGMWGVGLIKSNSILNGISYRKFIHTKAAVSGHTVGDIIEHLHGEIRLFPFF